MGGWDEQLQQEQDLVFQVMRREGDEQKMKQCQLLNGQHDMIVNSVSTLVVLDPWWMNGKGGGWRRHCGQWGMGPESSLLGKNSTKSIFHLCFQKLEGSEYKFSEAVKLDSYVNIISTGPPNVYYVGGKSGYLAKLSKS